MCIYEYVNGKTIFKYKHNLLEFSLTVVSYNISIWYLWMVDDAQHCKIGILIHWLPLVIYTSYISATTDLNIVTNTDFIKSYNMQDCCKLLPHQVIVTYHFNVKIGKHWWFGECSEQIYSNYGDLRQLGYTCMYKRSI
jgi:hypothetical protein